MSARTSGYEPEGHGLDFRTMLPASAGFLLLFPIADFRIQTHLMLDNRVR